MSELREHRISVSQQNYSIQQSNDWKITNRSAAMGFQPVEKQTSMRDKEIRGPSESNVTEITPSLKEPFQPKFKLNTDEVKRSSITNSV